MAVNATSWRLIEETIGDHTVARAHAGALLRFAADVWHFDAEGECEWVVRRAVDRALQELRDLFDDGEDMNGIDRIMGAVELWLRLDTVKAVLRAGALGNQIVDDAVDNDIDHVFCNLRRAADLLDGVGDRLTAA